MHNTGQHVHCPNKTRHLLWFQCCVLFLLTTAACGTLQAPDKVPGRFRSQHLAACGSQRIQLSENFHRNIYQQNSLFLLLQGFFSTGIADAVSYSLHTLCWSLNTGYSRRCLAYFSKFQEYQHAGKSVFIEWETKTSFVLDRKTTATNVSEVNNATRRYVLRTDAGPATSLHTTTILAACTMGQGTVLVSEYRQLSLQEMYLVKK